MAAVQRRDRVTSSAGQHLGSIGDGRKREKNGSQMPIFFLISHSVQAFMDVENRVLALTKRPQVLYRRQPTHLGGTFNQALIRRRYSVEAFLSHLQRARDELQKVRA